MSETNLLATFTNLSESEKEVFIAEVLSKRQKSRGEIEILTIYASEGNQLLTFQELESLGKLSHNNSNPSPKCVESKTKQKQQNKTTIRETLEAKSYEQEKSMKQEKEHKQQKKSKLTNQSNLPNTEPEVISVGSKKESKLKMILFEVLCLIMTIIIVWEIIQAAKFFSS